MLELYRELMRGREKLLGNGGEGEETPRNSLSRGKMGETELWDRSQGCAELMGTQFQAESWQRVPSGEAQTPQLCFVVA